MKMALGYAAERTPIVSGEDPACGKSMLIAAAEELKEQPNFITVGCEQCGRTEKFICD